MEERKPSYTLDIYKEDSWQSIVKDEEDIKKIDRALFQLTKLEYQAQLRVLKDGEVWLFLNNTDYQYLYWKNVYVREQGLSFATEKIYGKQLRKKKRSNNSES
jgi:hypothetical protein